LRFSLSYRDVEELLAERGLLVDHVTVWRVLVQFPINGCSFGKMIFWVLCRQNLRPKRSNGHCFFGQQSEVELVFLDLLC
jgi:hypothetical protein